MLSATADSSYGESVEDVKALPTSRGGDVEGETRLEVRVQGVNPMGGFAGDGGKAGGSIMSITRCKIVTITAS